MTPDHTAATEPRTGTAPGAGAAGGAPGRDATAGSAGPRAAPPALLPDLHYRLAHAARGHFPGAHRGHGGPGGLDYRGHARLLDAPDPRRLDLHASLRDPAQAQGHWQVRVFAQRVSVPVWVVADLSASMGVGTGRRKLDVLADLVEALAWSAWRGGDAFGFVGADERLREDWLRPASRLRGQGGPLAERLRAWRPDGRDALGLLEAAAVLGRRGLVFLVSDFHLPLAQVERLLDGLAVHELVPVLLWEPDEFDLGPRAGLARLRDPETGERRLVWWRPALRARWQAAQAARRAAVLAACRARRVEPLVIDTGFDPEAFTRHFTA
ncbi:DUF58 domain-containing protein [Piscinibacter sakaiensis]|uniref:DUF58 domain-containing protein n=1 Tax=Piscinibacter sakaiensis TaxID=1547922 RepID=A0A0K8NU31_PISS1|nr:DUF58 domain-containing protein [Piscinibacter sakaiensis]GAP33921.1 hypothetical protein ISF6_1699 [Piscinibacter sakaiensis]